MRKAFLKKLTEFASADSDVVLITGDLGFNFFEGFAEKFPEQFINAGIAEQSMAGIAAGMALAGKKVFMYSIGNFPTLRCLEQLRNDICYHNLPVCVVTNGGGMAYGYLGMSHHGTEDISVMRGLPNMTVCAPADPMEVEAGMDYLFRSKRPGFLRMNRGGEKVLYRTVPDLTLPKYLPLAENASAPVKIIGTGEIVSLLPTVADKLAELGVNASIWSCPVVKPLPQPEWTSDIALIVTVEENNMLGGLGGAVAEVLAGVSIHPPLLRIGMPDKYCSAVGKQNYLRDFYGLSVDKITACIERRFKEII